MSCTGKKATESFNAAKAYVYREGWGGGGGGGME